MAFWSSEKIKNECDKNRSIIKPFEEERVKNGSYELSLGNEVYITSKDTKHQLDINEQIMLPPGQFALLLVKEKITIPHDTIGLISIKATKKFQGLVNVSGFHVDPGFIGHLKFAVYNAGSKHIPLTQGEPLFLIWFSNLDQQTSDIYRGNHAKENKLSSDDIMKLHGDIASPAALNERLKAVEETISITKKVAKYFITGVVITIVATIGGNYIHDKIFNTQPSNVTKNITEKAK